MLNYVWIGLVVIGVLTAAGNDIYDASTNRYRNGSDFELQYDTTTGTKVAFGKDYFEKFYVVIIGSSDTIELPASLTGTQCR